MSDYQGEKFKQFLEVNKIKKVDALKKLGIVRSALYDYFKSKNMSRETVLKICKAFDVREEDIFGNESTLSNAHIYTTSGTGVANMFVVPVKAQGGFLSGYEITVFLDSLENSVFPFVKGECFAFEVDGFSMYKDYVPGDYVVTTAVEKLEWLSKDKVYVFQTVDGIILKCFERIEGDYIYLYSLNEEYNPVKPIHLKDVKKVYFKEKVIKN